MSDTEGNTWTMKPSAYSSRNLTPFAGDVIIGTGGLRKIRFSDARRSKGKRGGTRIIYYWWDGGSQFWLFTLYSKDEMTDLSNDQRNLLSQMLRNELKARGAQ